MTVSGAELTLTFDRDARLTMIHAGPQVPPAKGAWKLPSSYALEREPGATEVQAAWVRHASSSSACSPNAPAYWRRKARARSGFNSEKGTSRPMAIDTVDSPGRTKSFAEGKSRSRLPELAAVSTTVSRASMKGTVYVRNALPLPRGGEGRGEGIHPSRFITPSQARSK